MFESELSPQTSVERRRALREVLRAWLRDAGADHGAQEEIVLACWEATANALEHPVGADGRVRLVVEKREGHIIACVSDTGRWREPTDASVERGLGLHLIAGLMDRVQLVETKAGTRVLMCRCISTNCLSPQGQG